jgi:NADPH-dependent curcumin reductase CurA
VRRVQFMWITLLDLDLMISTTFCGCQSRFCACLLIVPLSCTGSDDKLKKCLELGADVGINYKKEDFVERAKAETGGKGKGCDLKFGFSAQVKLDAVERWR